ncbi:MAG: glycosyltransferase family 2 protein [Thermoplasmata archaeon]
MLDSKPLVSIGMPVYNGEKYIRQALDSLLAQDYENFELIISDNASEDKTPEICLEYAARDKRIRYYRNQKNMGAAWNFKRVFELSKGKYFMWAAHDDLWDKAYIRKCVEALEQNPSAVLCCTSLRFIDEEGKIIYGFTDEEGKIIYVPNYEEHYDNPDLSSQNVRERAKILAKRHGWYTIYGLIRPEALRKTRFFQPIFAPDVVLLMELCLLGPFIKVPEILFFYRQFRNKDRYAGSPIKIKPSHTKLGFDLLHTILISKLPPITKITTAFDFALTYFLYNPGSPIKTNPIREKIRLRTRMRNGFQAIQQISQDTLKIPQNIKGLISQKMDKSTKCALIEYNHYHEEILPTMIYILNSFGINNIDVYAPRAIIKNNPFVYSSGLRFNLRESDGLFFKLLIEPYHFRNYDLLIFNSIEPKEILQRISHISVPTIAVIHSGSLLKDDIDYINFFMNPIRKPIVLSPHISKFLSPTINVQWIWCVDIFEYPKIKKIDKTYFCVIEDLEFRRCNYESLIEAVEKLVAEGIQDFHIIVVSKKYTKYGLTFKQIVKDKKLDKFFTFSKTGIMYKEFYDLVAKAHFILPLIDLTKNESKPYFSEKNISSVNIAISFGTVPIIHKQLAQIYGIEDSSIKYEDGKLIDALKQAINTDEKTFEYMRNNLLSKKEILLNQSILNIKKVLNDLGLKI